MKRKSIKINPKMRGVFTKKAKRKKMSVQKYANYVIKKYKGKKKTKKQLKLLRQAVFAKTAKKWKKRKKKRGGDYSRIAKKLLKNKTRRKIKETEPQVRKIQQAYRDYRERKMENERFTDQNWEDLKEAYGRSADDLLAPPQGYDPFWGSDEDDY